MCRWLAYSGPALPIHRLLFEPSNGLIRQSLAARRAVTPTNGDGFGLAWYGNQPTPGLFRDTMPAWNDANLRSIAEHIASPLFFAHVRASTGTATTRLNCHPFRWGHWIFMHNGQIGGFAKVKRTLEAALPDSLYLAREGTTDSELFFLLWIANGLDADPVSALRTTLHQVQRAMLQAGIDAPLRMTAAASDGQRIIVVRHSSDAASPSLYFASGGEIVITGGEVCFQPGSGAALVLSEPLDGALDHWTQVPEESVLSICAGRVTRADLALS